MLVHAHVSSITVLASHVVRFNARVYLAINRNLHFTDV